MEKEINEEQEKKEILNRYKKLLTASRRRLEKGDKELIRKAFELAVEAHKDMRRKTGDLSSNSRSADMCRRNRIGNHIHYLRSIA